MITVRERERERKNNKNIYPDRQLICVLICIYICARAKIRQQIQYRERWGGGESSFSVTPKPYVSLNSGQHSETYGSGLTENKGPLWYCFTDSFGDIFVLIVNEESRNNVIVVLSICEEHSKHPEHWVNLVTFF